MDAASGDLAVVGLAVVAAIGMGATWCWAVGRWWTHRIRDRNAEAFDRWRSDVIERRGDEPRSRRFREDPTERQTSSGPVS